MPPLSVSLGIFYLPGMAKWRVEKMPGNWYAAHNRKGGWINRKRINTAKMEKHSVETSSSYANSFLHRGYVERKHFLDVRY